MFELEKSFSDFILVEVREEIYKERQDKFVELAKLAGHDNVNVMFMDIWLLADAIETKGNKGWTKQDVEKFDPHSLYLLNKEYSIVREGILYYAEGTRKRDFKGWYARKSPHWKVKLSEKLGWQHPKSKEVLAEQHAKAIAEDKIWQNKRARPQGIIKHHDLDQLTVTQLAHRYAVAYIMSRQPNTAHPLDKWVSNIWYAQYECLAVELVWRALYGTDAQKQEASKYVSLDKAHKFMQDTPLLYAAELCKDAILQFYSNDFMYNAMRRPIPVFWDEKSESNLPVPVALREAERMTDSQVIHKFWGMVGGDDFEAANMTVADKALILNQLRKLLKNTKGDW